jgi:hypothetical protein
MAQSGSDDPVSLTTGRMFASLPSRLEPVLGVRTCLTSSCSWPSASRPRSSMVASIWSYMDPNDPRFVLSIDPRTYEWGWHSDDAAFGRVAKGVVPKRARPGVNLADPRIRRRRRGSGLQESPLSSFITKARLTGRAVPLRLPRKLKPATLGSALDRAFSSKVGLATLPRAALAALLYAPLGLAGGLRLRSPVLRTALRYGVNRPASVHQQRGVFAHRVQTRAKHRL